MAVFAGTLLFLGPRDIWESLRGFHYPSLWLCLAVYCGASYLRIGKWILMKNRMAARLSPGEIQRIYFSSKFWGLVSPLRSGEIVPALLPPRREGDQARVLSIILYDRVLETFQTLVVSAALLVLLYGTFFNVGSIWVLAGLFAVLAVFTALLLSRRAGERLVAALGKVVARTGEGRVRRALGRVAEQAEAQMESFYGAMRSYFTPGFSLLALLLTFLCWGLDVLFWIVLFRAFGVDIGVPVMAAAVVIYSVAAAVVPVPNGLGFSDLTFAVVLGRFGYTGETGGLIVLSRVIIPLFSFLAYAFSRFLPTRRGGEDR